MERTACGSYTKCAWCINKNRCNRRGYNTDTGDKMSYFPDLWAIDHEEEVKKKQENWDAHLTDGWWRYR